MRIGLSCTSIEPAISQGKIDGIGTYTKNLLAEFSHLGHHVVPISFPHPDLNTSTYEGGYIFPFSYTKATLVSMLKPLHTQLNIDIFHTTDHMIPKLKNIPIVATVHDAMMFKYPQWYFSAKFGVLKKWLRKLSFQWADHVITGSHSMIPELVEYCGIKAKNISVVYDGISPCWQETITTQEKRQVIEKFHLPPAFILFAGTLQPKKNLPRLIQAYFQLPIELQNNFPLIVVGRTGWDAEESIASIKELEMNKKGIWLNYVTIEELRALFQLATIYAHPSLHEGFGLTLLQAFAAQTPVLTSNITAMPETAGGAAYLVNPHNVEEIREGLKNLLIDAELRDNLIEKGNRRMKDFSWRKCAEETVKVYQTIVK